MQHTALALEGELPAGVDMRQGEALGKGGQFGDLLGRGVDGPGGLSA